MKRLPLYKLGLGLLLGLSISCTSEHRNADPLPAWNNTTIKTSIIQYVSVTSQTIPVKNRIAIFDMDGTIACESPLWFEMYAAVNGLNQQSAKNPALLKLREYQYAKRLAINPSDTSVLNHWVSKQGNYIDSMVWKAYAGTDHEVYVDSARAYLSRTRDAKYKIVLSKMFYQPMVELIRFLQENKFTVYVVSGSVQGVIWSVCPQTIPLNRERLIGTRQIEVPSYHPAGKKTSFVIGIGIFLPKDDNNGKSLNIYSHIGKVPVFAFGNTNGDFGMFHLAATSKYPHAEYLLNHNDSIREYAYPPYHGAPVPHWKDSLKMNHWRQVNMAEEFKNVWISQ
jgi:hypothetical protein